MRGERRRARPCFDGASVRKALRVMRGYPELSRHTQFPPMQRSVSLCYDAAWMLQILSFFPAHLSLTAPQGLCVCGQSFYSFVGSLETRKWSIMVDFGETASMKGLFLGVSTGYI